MRHRLSKRRSWTPSVARTFATLVFAALAARGVSSQQYGLFAEDVNVSCSSSETLDSVIEFCDGGRSELIRADCAGTKLQYIMLDSDQMPLLSCLAVALVNRTAPSLSQEAPNSSLLEHPTSPVSLSQRFRSLARTASPGFVSNIAPMGSSAGPTRPHNLAAVMPSSDRLLDTDDAAEAFSVTDCYRLVTRSVDRLWILNQGDYVASQSYEEALNLTTSLASGVCTSVCNNACIDAVVQRFANALALQCDVTSSANQPAHCESDAAFATAMNAVCSEPAIMNANSSNADFDYCQMAMGRALMNTKRVPEASNLCGELAKLGSNPFDDAISCLYGVYLEYFYALSISLTPVEEWAPSACEYLFGKLPASDDGTETDDGSQVGRPEPVVCAGAVGTSLMHLTGFDVDASNGHCDTLSTDQELVTTCKTAVAEALAQRNENLASDLESCAYDIETEESECFSTNPQLDCEACFDTRDDPRCGNLGVEQCVCEYDAVCCNDRWDMSCVHLVSQFDCPCIAGNRQFVRKPPRPTTATSATPTPAPEVGAPQSESATSKSKFVAIYISIGTVIMCLVAAVVYRAHRAQGVASSEPTGPPGSNRHQQGCLDFLCPCFYRRGFQRVFETSGPLDDHDENLPSDEAIMQLHPIGTNGSPAGGALNGSSRLIADSDSDDGDDVDGFTADGKKSALRRARDALGGGKKRGTNGENRALTSDVGGRRSSESAETGGFPRMAMPPVADAPSDDGGSSADDEPINAADRIESGASSPSGGMTTFDAV